MSEHDWPLYANEPDRLILRGDLAEAVIADASIDISRGPESWHRDAPFAQPSQRGSPRD